ncbi:MAG: hypothetical protein WCT04_25990 [Planctomycetota bacterium]
MIDEIAIKKGSVWGVMSVIVAMISVGVHVFSINWAKQSGGFGLIGVSLAPVIIIIGGFIIASLLNFIGFIFSIFQFRRTGTTLAMACMLLNISIPIIAYGAFTSKL